MNLKYYDKNNHLNSIDIFSNSNIQYVQAQQSSYRVANPIRVFNYLCAAGEDPR